MSQRSRTSLNPTSGGFTIGDDDRDRFSEFRLPARNRGSHPVHFHFHGNNHHFNFRMPIFSNNTFFEAPIQLPAQTSTPEAIENKGKNDNAQSQVVQGPNPAQKSTVTGQLPLTTNMGPQFMTPQANPDSTPFFGARPLQHQTPNAGFLGAGGMMLGWEGASISSTPGRGKHRKKAVNAPKTV
ncbi:unnamed protein product [Orchesella dallaii]|uniref:Uncharacterized protein n=1 Tax=Orchesella dallaii TaxID=48710 RepID=A0ABP1QIP4_9HEXA